MGKMAACTSAVGLHDTLTNQMSVSAAPSYRRAAPETARVRFLNLGWEFRVGRYLQLTELPGAAGPSCCLCGVSHTV